MVGWGLRLSWARAWKNNGSHEYQSLNGEMLSNLEAAVEKMSDDCSSLDRQLELDLVVDLQEAL